MQAMAYLDRQGDPDGSTAVSHSRSEGVHVACLQQQAACQKTCIPTSLKNATT